MCQSKAKTNNQTGNKTNAKTNINANLLFAEYQWSLPGTHFGHLCVLWMARMIFSATWKILIAIQRTRTRRRRMTLMDIQMLLVLMTPLLTPRTSVCVTLLSSDWSSSSTSSSSHSVLFPSFFEQGNLKILGVASSDWSSLIILNFIFINIFITINICNFIIAGTQNHHHYHHHHFLSLVAVRLT